MSLPGRRHLQRPTVGLSVLSCVGIAVLWILFVGGTRAHEMLVGAIVLVLSAAFLFRVHQTESLRLDFRMADVVTCWRIPWYIVSGIYEIAVVLAKDLLGKKKAGSFYRFSGFRTSGHDPVLIARSVLAIGYTTTAPNFIILGIDCAQSRMLFHQLERSEVPKMTKELGAQPGAERA